MIKLLKGLIKYWKINPEFLEAYLYLADIYVSKNDKDKAIDALEQFKTRIKDPEKVAQISAYQQEIKESN